MIEKILSIKKGEKSKTINSLKSFDDDLVIQALFGLALHDPDRHVRLIAIEKIDKLLEEWTPDRIQMVLGVAKDETNELGAQLSALNILGRVFTDDDFDESIDLLFARVLADVLNPERKGTRVHEIEVALHLWRRRIGSDHFCRHSDMETLRRIITAPVKDYSRTTDSRKWKRWEMEKRKQVLLTLLSYYLNGDKKSTDYVYGVICETLRNPNPKIRMMVLLHIPDFVATHNEDLCVAIANAMRNDPDADVRYHAIITLTKLNYYDSDMIWYVLESGGLFQSTLSDYAQDMFQESESRNPPSELESLFEKSMRFIALMDAYPATLATLAAAAHLEYKAILTVYDSGGAYLRKYAYLNEARTLSFFADHLLDLLAANTRTTTEHLVKLLTQATYPDNTGFILAMIRLAERVRDTRLVEPLIQLTSSKIPSIRCHAVDALGKQGDIRALKPIKKVTKHCTSAVVVARARLGDEFSEKELQKGLRNEDKDLCVAYIQAAGILGSSNSVGTLFEILESADEERAY